jgi:hypothetical protein
MLSSFHGPSPSGTRQQKVEHTGDMLFATITWTSQFEQLFDGRGVPSGIVHGRTEKYGVGCFDPLVHSLHRRYMSAQGGNEGD